MDDWLIPAADSRAVVQNHHVGFKIPTGTETAKEQEASEKQIYNGTFILG